MARKRVFTDGLLDYATRLMETLTVTETAARLGVDPDLLSRRLRERGITTRGIHYRPAHNAKEYPRDALPRLYADGWSVKQLAERFGVARATVRSELLRQGLEPRNRTEAMFVRHLTLTPEERKKLAEAAHQMARGRRRTAEQKRAAARRQVRLVGEGENVLADALETAGYAFERQAPVDIYNVDLLVGAVAVEPSCSSVSKARRPDILRRTEKINETGLHTLQVFYKLLADLIGCMKYILADLDEMSRLPSFPRENRVVWCTAKRYALVRNERGQMASIPTPVEFVYERRY